MPIYFLKVLHFTLLFILNKYTIYQYVRPMYLKNSPEIFTKSQKAIHLWFQRQRHIACVYILSEIKRRMYFKLHVECISYKLRLNNPTTKIKCYQAVRSLQNIWYNKILRRRLNGSSQFCGSTVVLRSIS